MPATYLDFSNVTYNMWKQFKILCNSVNTLNSKHGVTLEAQRKLLVSYNTTYGSFFHPHIPCLKI